MSAVATSGFISGAAAAAPFRMARGAAQGFEEALASAAGSNEALRPTTGKAAELRRTAEMSLAEFKRTLRQLFAEAGIDTSQPIRLEVDGQGGVQVAGFHPDRAKIEQLFHDNADLAAKFQALAQRFTEIHTMEQGSSGEKPLIPPSFGLAVMGDEMVVNFQ